MITISLCMIVKNEEESLGRCLASVKEAMDEIIIADTGSTDRTKEIAESFGAKVYDFPWIDDFGAARNFSFSKATQKFIMWLDADDVLGDEDLQGLLALKQQKPFDYDSVTMNYVLTVDQKGNPVYSLRRNRLVRRSCGFQWHGPVHEYLAVSGSVYNSDIAVRHRKERTHTDRNLQIYLKRKEKGENFSPRDQYYFANELRDNGRYAEAIDMYEQFLNTRLGWVEDEIGACMKQAFCYGQLMQREKQMQALFRTLVYDLPRAEFCCQLGNVFMESGRWQQAIHWFRQATLLEVPAHLLSPIDHASWTWLPHLQLTVCYDRIGDRERALAHHEETKKLNPEHPSVKFNENYFNNLAQ
ncbi:MULTISPECIES: glycosyltransferase [unclassified Paenibacillus]|uniref:glycosyltransferase n=1 Tax=unclassified Paenibacillus TaxID=185978 RepID=UPI002F4143A5